MSSVYKKEITLLLNISFQIPLYKAIFIAVHNDEQNLLTLHVC